MAHAFSKLPIECLGEGLIQGWEEVPVSSQGHGDGTVPQALHHGPGMPTSSLCRGSGGRAPSNASKTPFVSSPPAYPFLKAGTKVTQS